MADDQGYVPFDPNKPLQPTAQPKSAASGDSQGYVPLTQPGGQQSPAPAQPSQGWGINWRTGDITMPQPVQDFGDVAGNEALVGLPALLGEKARVDAARARLGPAGAASADVVGGALSPTNLLYALGPAGPGLAGATHEGIKSWAQGNDPATIGWDTLAGAGFGYLGQGVAKAAPTVLPQLTKAAVDLGPAAGMTYVAHKLFGEPSKDILGALGGYALMHNLSEGAGEQAKKLASSPYVQQAIKNLVLGTGSAARQGLGPWDQWVPGQ